MAQAGFVSSEVSSRLTNLAICEYGRVVSCQTVFDHGQACGCEQLRLRDTFAGDIIKLVSDLLHRADIFKRPGGFLKYTAFPANSGQLLGIKGSYPDCHLCRPENEKLASAHDLLEKML